MLSTLRCPETSRQLDFPPSMNCQACGAALAATAKFCHKCGAQASSAPAAGWRAGLPWGVAGAAVGALVTVLALRLGGPAGRGGGGAGGGGGGAPPPAPHPPPPNFHKFPPEAGPPPLQPLMLRPP